MLEARSLTKFYDHTAAVRGVSFSIRPGEILGYLGPNAGKGTTTKPGSSTMKRPIPQSSP